MKKGFMNIYEKEYSVLYSDNPVKSNDDIFFNSCFDKGHVKDFVSWFLDHYGQKRTINFLESLKSLGFQKATEAGISLGVDDLEIPPEKQLLITQAFRAAQSIQQNCLAGDVTSVEKSQGLIDTWNQTSDLLRQNAIQYFRTTNPLNPVYIMAFSGARGNISQVRQLVAMRGLMANPQGAILEFPIQSNFREGLTITEYLISCYGARKGLVDTALRTATSGYLTRRLVDAAQHAIISMIDCETERDIILQGENLEKRLIGRVLSRPIQHAEHRAFSRNSLISKSDAQCITKYHRQIFVRSPLTCESITTVCQFCYGSDLASGKLVQIGEAVGVIAAQSIGEPGTQLTMRTFHTGGVGVFSNQTLKTIRAPYQGKVHFPTSIPGCFVRTPHGQIAYMVKNLNVEEEILKNPEQPILILEPLEPVHVPFAIHEQEVPSGSLLFVKQGEIVSSHHVLAQASNVKIRKQKFPESQHPVYSPIEGEIFFEDIWVLFMKPIKRQFIWQHEERTIDTSPSIVRDKFPGVPVIPRIALGSIGSLWVLAGGDWRNLDIPSWCLEPGDLVTNGSLLSQYIYRFQTSRWKRLHITDSTVNGVSPSFEFEIGTVYLSATTYKIRSNTKTLLYQTITPSTRRIILYIQKSYDSKHRRNVSMECNLQSKMPHFGNVQSCINLPTRFVYTHSIPLYTELHNRNNQNNRQFLRGSIFLNPTKEKHASVNKVSRGGISAKEDSSTSPLEKITGLLKLRSNYKPQQNKRFKQFSTSFLNIGIQRLGQKCSFQARPFARTWLHSTIRTGWVHIEQQNSKIRTLQPQFYPTGLLSETICIPKYSTSYQTIIPAIKTTKQIAFRGIPLSSKNPQREFFLPTLRSFLTCPAFTEGLAAIPEKECNAQPLLLVVQKDTRSWYEKTNLLTSLDIPYVYQRRENTRHFNQHILRTSGFSFGVLWYGISLTNDVVRRPISALKLQMRSLKYAIPLSLNIFRPLVETTIPQQQNFRKQTLKFSTPISLCTTQSPIFCKQKPTRSVLSKRRVPFIWEMIKRESAYFIPDILFSYQLKTKLPFPTCSFYSVTKSSTRVLSMFQCHPIDFLNPYGAVDVMDPCQSSFLVFLNNCILPGDPVLVHRKQIQTEGEFQYTYDKKMAPGGLFLRKSDIVTLHSPKTSTRFGFNELIRTHEELIDGLVSPRSGQIISITEQTLTLRCGVPILASARGLLHTWRGDIVSKKDLLITLQSRRLQTEDIVQGIPKIEQLFEAKRPRPGYMGGVSAQLYRATKANMDTWIRFGIRISMIRRALRLLLPAQCSLVKDILEAYANQGVDIAEKHVEVLVRQMTNRVIILRTLRSGLLPGEFIQSYWLEKIVERSRDKNRRELLWDRHIYCAPMVLGISKSVLHSESFLLAASFQEVSRVLVRSALSYQRDFLRGLHENVIIGQHIPAGTGLIVTSQHVGQTMTIDWSKILFSMEYPSEP
jgi:hypothetical protein